MNALESLAKLAGIQVPKGANHARLAEFTDGVRHKHKRLSQERQDLATDLVVQTAAHIARTGLIHLGDGSEFSVGKDVSNVTVIQDPEGKLIHVELKNGRSVNIPLEQIELENAQQPTTRRGYFS